MGMDGYGWVQGENFMIGMDETILLFIVDSLALLPSQS